ncbi:PREDICTED: uncharacterized protein LOC106343604 isoform X2 [Brassica oleracea var. oleracea]|uniref:uncharacterized protein LOC106343604 isoform X2 n=1 Tax=Brassica oleracea var. oleracea TaxID=109376 RepID=UPI0006A7468C|nr:PREDICTED: uncharacterized protein LOC106343604 isoform X2 [Brassica oleracea var. oleracea]
MTFSRWRVTDRRRIQEGGERALCYREDEEESRVSEGFCGFNRSREIWLGDLRGCDNLLEGLELVTFNLLRGEATRDEEDRETFGSRSGFGLMVIIRRCLRFLGWKRGDRGGSGRKGHLLLITYSWMTRALQTFTILFSKDTSRREQFYLDVLDFMGAKTEKMVSHGILVLGCGSGSSRTFTPQSVNLFDWSL